MFLWYNEDEPSFVELETLLDKENMTVSVKTTHFSKYMIVDKNVWRGAWAEEISYDAQDGIDTYYTVLTIDCSGSMRYNDPIIYNNNISSAYDSMYNRKNCNRIKGALEFVDCMGENDRVAVVLFDATAFYTLDFTNDKEAIKLALQKICNGGTTNYSRAIRESVSLFPQNVIDSSNICTRIIFLSDGEGKCDSQYITMTYEKDVIIHGIGLGNDVDDEYLQEITEGTRGSYYQTDTSEMLSALYEKIYLYDQFDKSDDDKDGLYDIFETAGIRLINGQVIYTDPTDDDSDDDGLLDGKEIIPEVKKADEGNFLLKELLGDKCYYLEMVSDPNMVDTDNDNASDKDDYTPLVCNEWRSYLFYGLYGDDHMVREADTRWKIMTNMEDKTVHKMGTTDIKDFQERWAQMGMIEDKIAYQIEEVHLIYHGGPRGIEIFDGECLLASQSDSKDGSRYEPGVDITIMHLESKDIYYLNLSSCNNGNLDFMTSNGVSGYYDNMAISFLKSQKHNIKLVTAWDGNAVYDVHYHSYYDLQWISGRGEYSNSSDSFRKWSMDVNGYERKPKQRIMYWIDEKGSIQYKAMIQ